MFDAYDVSLELARSLRPHLARLRAYDASLTNQLTRSLTSVPLNLSEGRRRAGKDRTHLFRIAAGSVAEVRACLDTAEALGYVEHNALDTSLVLMRSHASDVLATHALSLSPARRGPRMAPASFDQWVSR